VALHLTGRPVSYEMAELSGPRNWVQSAADVGVATRKKSKAYRFIEVFLIAN
jgi:hypothetical protein